MTMITRKLLANQLPVETIADLKELRFLHHLRTAGIKKRLGFSVSELFLLIFSLAFQHRNWFQLLASSKATDLPGKDAVYRFLNHPCFHWRKFLIGLSADAMRRVNRLTARDRIKVLIVDDSMYERNRSKKVELLARFTITPISAFIRGFGCLLWVGLMGILFYRLISLCSVHPNQSFRKLLRKSINALAVGIAEKKLFNRCLVWWKL